MRKLPKAVQSDDEKPKHNVRQTVRGVRIWYSGAWRTPEAVERSRARGRERDRISYKTDENYRRSKSFSNRCLNLEYKAKTKRDAKAYYERNKERLNAKRNALRKQKREHTLKLQRANYRKNAAENAAKERARRDKRNPARILRRATKQFAGGQLSYSGFIETFRREIVQLNGGDSKRDRPSEKQRRRSED